VCHTVTVFSEDQNALQQPGDTDSGVWYQRGGHIVVALPVAQHLNTVHIFQSNLPALLTRTPPKHLHSSVLTASTPTCCVLSPWDYTPFHITVRLNCHSQHLTDPLSPKAAD